MKCEDIFSDSVLTEAHLVEDLEILADYCEQIKIEKILITQPPMPALAMMMEDDEQDRVRVVTASFLPMDRDSAEHTKYLQYYMELENRLDDIPRTELLETLVWVNATVPIGSCLLLEPEGDRPLRAVIRAANCVPMRKPVDPAVFAESLFVFDSVCNMVSTFLDQLAEGKTFAEIRAEVPHS